MKTLIKSYIISIFVLIFFLMVSNILISAGQIGFELYNTTLNVLYVIMIVVTLATYLGVIFFKDKLDKLDK
jgi:hypothetical protein